MARRLALVANGIDTGQAMSQENVEWEEQSIPGVDAIFRGHDGVRRWSGLVVGQELRSLEGQIERIEEADDAVLASVVVKGEGSSSGVRVQMLAHMVVSFRAGKVIRREVFGTLAEAREAAGLR